MAKMTPNVPYDDLGNSHQIAEFHAAWVMESSESVEYLALSEFRPELCGSKVVRRASFGDIEALVGGVPVLPQRSYRIGSEQGIVVLEAMGSVREASALPNHRYRWVVTLEPLIAIEVNEMPVGSRRGIDRSGVRGIVEAERGSEGSVVEERRSPRLLIRRQ